MKLVCPLPLRSLPRAVFDSCAWRWLKWYRICPKCGRPTFVPWVGKIPWRRECNPPQDCCLENPMDRGAYRGAIVHGAEKSRPRLSDSHTQRVMSSPVVYWALTVSQALHEAFSVCSVTLILVLWGWFPSHRWGSEVHWSYVTRLRSHAASSRAPPVCLQVPGQSLRPVASQHPSREVSGPNTIWFSEGRVRGL